MLARADTLGIFKQHVWLVYIVEYMYAWKQRCTCRKECGLVWFIICCKL